MSADVSAVVAAIRAQPWAILPEYLEAIEAIALRAMDAGVLKALAEDGHRARLEGAREAVAAVGERLPGAYDATVRNGAAVVPMLGAIFPRSNMLQASSSGTSLDTFMRDVRVAQASDQVERIVLLVDSPGGVVSGLGEVADALRASGKPLTAYVTGMAASAAYWLASQAREIVLDRAASVGSIGVVVTGTRQEGPDAQGRRSYEVVSRSAPRKRPDLSSEEGRASVQEEVDAIEAVFIADVARGRGVTPAVVRSDFGQGGMVPARAAIAAGMADRIGTLEGVLSTGSRRTGANPPGPRRALAAAEVETRRRAAERT